MLPSAYIPRSKKCDRCTYFDAKGNGCIVGQSAEACRSFFPMR